MVLETALCGVLQTGQVAPFFCPPSYQSLNMQKQENVSEQHKEVLDLISVSGNLDQHLQRVWDAALYKSDPDEFDDTLQEGLYFTKQLIDRLAQISDAAFRAAN